MAIVLPDELAERILSWMRQDAAYSGMRLEDLLSEQDLIACIVALRGELESSSDAK